MSSLNTNTVITNKVYEKTIKIFAKNDDISSLPSTITINVNSIELTMHVDKTTSKPIYYIPISDVINYFKNAGTINETNNNVLFYKYYSSGSDSNSFSIVTKLNELLERITGSNYQLFFIKKSCFENSGSDHLINETSNITSLIGYSTTSFNKDDYILVHVNYDTIDHETNTSIMYNSHASGVMTNIYGRYSNTEGFKTTVMGYEAHAEGDNTVAIGRCSHAEGNYTIADINNMTAIGSYNKPNYDVYVNDESNIYITDDKTTYTIDKSSSDPNLFTATHKTITGNVITNLTKYASGDETLKDKIFVVGNGTDNNNRSNAFIVDKDGNAIVQNNLTVNNNKIMSSDLNIYYFIKNINDSSLLLNKDFTYVNITNEDINVNFFYVDEYGNRKSYVNTINGYTYVSMTKNKAYKISIVNGEKKITPSEVNLSNIPKAIDIVTNNVYTYTNANSTWTIDNEQKFIVSKDNSTITSNALVSDTLYTNNISSNSMKPIVNYEIKKIIYDEETGYYEEADKINILPDSEKYSVNCGNTIQIEKTHDTTINLKAYKYDNEGNPILYDYCKLESRNGMTLYNDKNDRNTYINDDKIALSSDGITTGSKSLIELQQSEDLVNAQINIYDNIDDKQYLSSMRANEFDTTDINAQNINTYTFKIEVSKELRIRATDSITMKYENGYYGYQNTETHDNISSTIDGKTYYWFYTKNDNTYSPLETITAITTAMDNNTLIYFDENLLFYSNNQINNPPTGSQPGDGNEIGIRIVENNKTTKITYDGNFPSVIMIAASESKVDFKIKPLDKIKCYCLFDRYVYPKLKDTTFYLTFKNDYYYIDIKDIVYSLHDNCTDFLTACTSLTTNNTTDNVLYNICNFDDILKHINHIYLYDTSVVNKAFLPFCVVSWSSSYFAKICVSKSSLNTNVDNNYLTIQSFTDIGTNIITEPSTDPSTKPLIRYDIITQSYSSSLLTDKDLNVQTINTSDIIIRKYKVMSNVSSGITPINIECEYGYSYQKIKLVLTYNKDDKYYYFDTKDILNYMNYITSITPTNYLLLYRDDNNNYLSITSLQLLNTHINNLYLNISCIKTKYYSDYLGFTDNNPYMINVNDMFVLSNANNSITLSSIILTNGKTSIKLYIDENNELAVKNVNTNSTATMSLYGTIELK